MQQRSYLPEEDILYCRAQATVGLRLVFQYLVLYFKLLLLVPELSKLCVDLFQLSLNIFHFGLHSTCQF